MTQGKYFATDMKVEADRERLSLLEQTYDPITFRHLERLGVAPGWTCLEIGAGYGSVTEWLAKRVGGKGKVVATDLRPALIRPTNDTVEIRQHDILHDDIEKGRYDLAHCRAVLMHLKDPKAALSRMADALKPGGWLLIEEFDNRSVRAADATYPFADSFTNYSQLANDSLVKSGLMDPYIGSRARMLVDHLQFQETGHEGFAPLPRGGEPLAMWFLITARAIESGISGSLSAEQARVMEFSQRAQQLLQDPSFYFVGNTMFSVWARKPG